LNAMEKAGSNILSSDSQTAAANGSDFQAMLTNQIQKNASEFVRAGNIVLRDNDSGQIKLVLHPENLGNVKIDLQISDKNITGRILVASSQAYNAFKESAESLRNAFVSSGFESASFDLNYSGQGAEQNNGGQNRDNNTQYVISRTYGEYASSVGFDDFDERVDFDAISSKNAVNIVA
ncbi:MAG: flagellar hook-length control protein FliK, partial [Treponemataceae bacterium]|nr:flagellar hook-length control protein FliK [Treponemataceae bacterium]